MMCGKCHHEFCWWCLDSYYQYRHSENRLCPFRYTAVNGSLVLTIILLDYKLIYLYPTLFAIQWFIFYNLGAFVFLKAFIGSIIFYGYFYDEYNRARVNYRQWRNTYMSKCKRVTLSILFTILLCSHLTIAWVSVKYDFTWRSLEILYYELILALIVGACYITFLCVRWLFMYCRYVYKRYILKQTNYNFDGTYTR